MAKSVSEEYLRRAALHYLNRYNASESSLRRVLKRKIERRAQEAEQSPEDYYELIDPVVAFCREHAFVDDQRFAQSKIRTGTSRGKSQSRLRMELAAKGVAGETISLAFEEEDHSEQRAALAHARRRRLGPWRTKLKDDVAQKELASFVRAGFSYALAQQIQNMSLDEAEELFYAAG